MERTPQELGREMSQGGGGGGVTRSGRVLLYGGDKKVVHAEVKEKGFN